jgi:hypothetical protein
MYYGVVSHRYLLEAKSPVECSLTGWKGRMLNRDYQVTAKAHDFVVDTVAGDDLSKFPIEKARLRSMWYMIPLCAACVIGYGWAVERKMVCNTTHISTRKY